MTIENSIDSLVSYAMNKGLTQPEDHIVVVNKLLEELKLDSGLASAINSISVMISTVMMVVLLTVMG